MIKNILSSKRVIVGLLYICFLLVISFGYEYFKNDLPIPSKLMYDDTGKLIATAPYTPTEFSPLGTDRVGNPILYKIMQGAKYTLGLAVLIAFLRILIGSIMGIIVTFYAPKLKRFIQIIDDTCSGIPTIFLAYLLIKPIFVSVIGMDEQAPLQTKLIVYQFAVVVALLIPSITMYISNELDELVKNDYVHCTKVMGASKWYIIKRHAFLFLKDKWVVLFIQHIIQALILLVHLGFLHIFIGGERVVTMDIGYVKHISLTNEWSGIIGVDFYELRTAPWIILGPLTAFGITIFFFNLILEGVKDKVIRG